MPTPAPAPTAPVLLAVGEPTPITWKDLAAKGKQIQNVTGPLDQPENDYKLADNDKINEVSTKANNCFNKAKEMFDTIFWIPNFGTNKQYKYKNPLTSKNKLSLGDLSYKDTDLTIFNNINSINENLTKLKNYIDQGIINLQVLNWLREVAPTSGGNKNKKNRNQDGGSVPDLINNVAAFQNMGGLLTAGASPYDNAVAPNYAMYNAGSFNAGINMPVSSSAGLPVPYKMSFDQKVQTGGKSKKSNKSNKNN